MYVGTTFFSILIHTWGRYDYQKQVSRYPIAMRWDTPFVCPILAFVWQYASNAHMTAQFSVSTRHFVYDYTNVCTDCKFVGPDALYPYSKITGRPHNVQHDVCVCSHWHNHKCNYMYVYPNIWRHYVLTHVRDCVTMHNMHCIKT